MQIPVIKKTKSLKIKPITVIYTALTILLSPLVFAQKTLLQETDLFGDLPVLTSASRLKQNSHTSPAAVTVIDQKQIKASGAQTLPELLTLAPGFQIFHLNTNRHGVNYHGVNDEFPNQLEIMVNGRSVYLPLLSTVLWNTLGFSIDDIERVEIIRGSNSATYGSNAFLGAINFVTKEPMLEDHLRYSMTIGSMNTVNANLINAGQNESVFYRVSVSTEKNNGNKIFNDGLNRKYINTQWLWTPSINDSIRIELSYDKGFSHIGYLYNYENRFPEREYYVARQDYEADHQYLNWTRWLNENNQLHVHLYRNKVALNEAKPTESDLATFYLRNTQNPEVVAKRILAQNPNFRGYREHGNTHVMDFETGLEYVKRNVKSYSGIGFRQENASSPVLLQSGKVSSKKLRLFQSTEIQHNTRLKSHTGVMYEHESNQINAISARVALNYQLSNYTSIRLGASQSKRLPSLLERYGNYKVEGSRFAIDTANLTLKPERIRSIELGGFHQLKSIEGSVDIRIFHENISDAIVNVKNNVGMKHNSGYWSNNGIETQLKIQPFDQFWGLLNYSYLVNRTGQWEQGDHGKFNGGQLSPRHTLSALVNWEIKPDLNMGAKLYALDHVRWRKSYGTLNPQPQYQRLDLKVAKVWRTNEHNIELSAVFQNINQPKHQGFYEDFMFERKAFLNFIVSMD